jgi:hypothetical protein
MSQDDDIPAKQLDEKFSLWGAATLGLALSSFVLLTSGLATRSYILASTGYEPTAGQLGELTGELSGFPLLFVLIALIRNTVRRRSLRPSSASVGRRMAVFFGILLAVGILLRVFGTLYFSRDETISGDARDDFVESFVSGCLRSHRAAAVSAGATESQINSYCNCLANSIASILTYKQLGARNYMPDAAKAAGQATPACRAKSFG